MDAFVTFLALVLPSGSALNGAVVDSLGQPVKGATVFIDVAGPRKGVGIL
jgi:hypothetical protein